MKLSSFNLGNGSRTTGLLHGFLGSGRNLRTLAQQWSERDPSRTFVLMDLRGHGASPPPSAATDLTEMGCDVLETLAGRSADLVGHSLGGRVALAAAASSPERVRHVTMLDITPAPVDDDISESAAVLKVLRQAPMRAPDRRQMRAFLLEKGLTPSLADWLLMNLVRDGNDFAWQFDREALGHLHDHVLGEDQWSAVDQLGSRVHCIRGSKSPYVPEEDVERLKRAGCRVDTLEGAGHYVHVDALDALLPLLL
ncbi:MAG: alpha/beta fold hydrolase [Myxococcaceae bacterium]